MMMMEDGKDQPTGWDDLIDIQGRLASMVLYRLPGRVPKHRVVDANRGTEHRR
jgi:hypothetical protein